MGAKKTSKALLRGQAPLSGNGHGEANTLFPAYDGADSVLDWPVVEISGDGCESSLPVVSVAKGKPKVVVLHSLAELDGFQKDFRAPTPAESRLIDDFIRANSELFSLSASTQRARRVTETPDGDNGHEPSAPVAKATAGKVESAKKTKKSPEVEELRALQKECARLRKFLKWKGASAETKNNLGACVAELEMRIKSLRAQLKDRHEKAAVLPIVAKAEGDGEKNARCEKRRHGRRGDSRRRGDGEKNCRRDRRDGHDASSMSDSRPSPAIAPSASLMRVTEEIMARAKARAALAQVTLEIEAGIRARREAARKEAALRLMSDPAFRAFTARVVESNPLLKKMADAATANFFVAVRTAFAPEFDESDVAWLGLAENAERIYVGEELPDELPNVEDLAPVSKPTATAPVAKLSTPVAQALASAASAKLAPASKAKPQQVLCFVCGGSAQPGPRLKWDKPQHPVREELLAIVAADPHGRACKACLYPVLHVADLPTNDQPATPDALRALVAAQKAMATKDVYAAAAQVVKVATPALAVIG